jgi:phosphatidate cytidylyltransferase
MSNLQLRVISAIVLAAGVLALTWNGGLPFRILAAVIAAAILYEWATMARLDANALNLGTLAALLAVFLAMFILGAPALVSLAALAFGVVAAAALGAWLGRGMSGAAGLAYAALSGFSLALLRGDGVAGLRAVLFLFAVVWATDIMAYFTGRALGGRRLAPSISPGKTWSGAIGGTISGIAAGLIVATYAAPAIGLAAMAVVALLLSTISQIGDLFESGVKRRYGVKDSSRLIPGHGGVMDRVDGLVAAAFALYVIGWFLAGPDNPARGLFLE